MFQHLPMGTSGPASLETDISDLEKQIARSPRPIKLTWNSKTIRGMDSERTKESASDFVDGIAILGGWTFAECRS